MKTAKTNSRGFNLFTALVSFLFITLTVLLWQSMIQSERKTSDMFRAAEDRMKIEAIADNAVTDAVQTFNYTLRKKTADYVTNYPFELPDLKWNELVGNFVETRFGSGESEQFAFEVARDIKYYFANTWNFKTYSIQTENAQNEDTLTLVLKDLVNNTIQEQKFFNVVGCEGGNPGKCELGTFYVNLDVTKLTPEQYEKLPRMVVTNTATHDEIRHVILPKETFRIYVPIRLFKAFAEARGLAHFSETPNQDIDMEIMDKANDIGLLSDKTTNEIDSMQLGMCDAFYCHPRTSPCSQPAAKELSNSGCPGDSSINPQKVMMPLNYQGCNWYNSTPLPGTYNAYFTAGFDGSTNGGPTVLKNIVASRVCDLAKKASENGYFATASTGQPGITSDFQPSSVGDCPDYIETELVTIGLMNKEPNGGKKQLVEKTLTGYSLLQNQKSFCAKTRAIEATVAFTDNNPAYTIEQGKAPTYRITIVNNREQLQLDSPGSPGEQGWKCVSKREPVGFGIPKPVACKLPV